MLNCVLFNFRANTHSILNWGSARTLSLSFTCRSFALLFHSFAYKWIYRLGCECVNVLAHKPPIGSPIFFTLWMRECMMSMLFISINRCTWFDADVLALWQSIWKVSPRESGQAANIMCVCVCARNPLRNADVVIIGLNKLSAIAAGRLPLHIYLFYFIYFSLSILFISLLFFVYFCCLSLLLFRFNWFAVCFMLLCRCRCCCCCCLNFIWISLSIFFSYLSYIDSFASHLVCHNIHYRCFCFSAVAATLPFHCLSLNFFSVCFKFYLFCFCFHFTEFTSQQASRKKTFCFYLIGPQSDCFLSFW